MDNELTQAQLAEKWLEVLSKRFEKKQIKLKIGETLKLRKSLIKFGNLLLNSNGDPAKIEIAFEWYGRMVDMGVGRGTSLDGVGEDRRVRQKSEALKNSRKPKKWYSVTMAAELHTLSKLMAENFGIQTLQMVESNMKNTNKDGGTIKINF